MKNILFSVRPMSDKLIVKLDEDAKKQDRSRNYIINDILMKHYELARD
jgi:predicted transcriptional regulator